MDHTLPESLRVLISGSLIIFLGNAFGMGSSFMTRVVAARYLPPASYGLIVLGVTLLNIAAILVLLGLHQGLAQRLPRSDDAEEQFVSALQLSIAFAIVLTGFAIYFSRSIARVFTGSKFEPLLIVFALAVPFMVLMEVTVGAFRGLEKAGYRVLTKDVLFKGGLFLIVAVGANAGASTVGVAGAWLGSLVVATLGGMYLLIRRTSLLNPRSVIGLPDPEITYALTAFSLPLMVSGTSWFMMQHIDNALLGLILSSDDVGIYDAAYSLATSLMLISSTFGFLFLPVFSGLHARDERNQMMRFYRIVTKWMVFLALPPCIVLVLNPEPIMTLVYGGAYAGGSVALAIVVLGLFVNIVAGNTDESIVALGNSRMVLVGNLSALILNVAINLALIPVLGIVGAAVATLVSYTWVNLFYGYYLFTSTGIHPLYPSLIRPALGAGTAFLFAVAVLKYANVDPRVQLLLALPLVIPYLGLLLLFGGVDREEIDVLTTIDDDLDINIRGLIAVLERFS